MTLRDMQYVSAIAEEKSFSRAAERLFVSQPALSQAVNRLEKELNVTLFTRSGGSVSLTNAGIIFMDNALQVLQADTRLEGAMREIANKKDETLRVGISLFYGSHHLSRFLKRFLDNYPAVQIDLTEANSAQLEALVAGGSLDVAFVPFPLSDEQLGYEVLYMEEIMLAVPPGHPMISANHTADRQGYPYIDLAQASGEPFIFLKQMRFTSLAHELCAEAGFSPHIIFETRNWDTAHALVKSGLGVSFIPEIVVPREHTPGSPGYFHINSPKAARRYAAVYKKHDALSNAALHMIRIAREAFTNT